MKTERGGFRIPRREQIVEQPLEDSYRIDAKLPDPTRCPACNATYLKGRWTWEKSPADAVLRRCPACQRIHDHFPAGYLTIKGKLSPELRAQALSLIHTRETRAKTEHPMQRIMAIEDTAGGILVTTTDTHLARNIAHALRDALQGTLELTYAHDENLVRATWRPPR